MSDGRSPQRIISWTSYCLYWGKNIHIPLVLPRKDMERFLLDWVQDLLVGPELSDRANVGSQESTSCWLSGQPFWMCLNAPRVARSCFSTELYAQIWAACDHSGVVTLKTGCFPEAASVRACRKTFVIFAQLYKSWRGFRACAVFYIAFLSLDFLSSVRSVLLLSY